MNALLKLQDDTYNECLMIAVEYLYKNAEPPNTVEEADLLNFIANFLGKEPLYPKSRIQQEWCDD